MKINKNLIGRKVRALDEESYALNIGDIGTIVKYEATMGDMHYRVRWDYGGSQIDLWSHDNSIELIEDKSNSTHMPYDEIWKMLKPKMKKNGFAEKEYYYDECGLAPISGYDAKDFQKAVALVYKIGYERAMKGRPFKYDEKKVKKVEGHWEKVDLNNLPKNGTKVRFARNGKQDHLKWSGMKIGDTGIVEIDGTFDVKPDHLEYDKYYWVSFDADSADSLDYWVEGDDVN